MGIGFDHHRPAKRQRDVAGSSWTATARGHDTSTAAAMAAASSSVGVGEISIAYSGTLPCLRFGSSSRFDRSSSRPAMSLMRVSAGSITSSTKPRSAAT